MCVLPRWGGEKVGPRTGSREEGGAHTRLPAPILVTSDLVAFENSHEGFSKPKSHPKKNLNPIVRKSISPTTITVTQFRGWLSQDIYIHL